MLVDAIRIDDISAGTGFGEVSLLFDTRRNATVRAVGPCEIIALDRASYHTAISVLPDDKRIGKLERVLRRFWSARRPTFDPSTRTRIRIHIYTLNREH